MTELIFVLLVLAVALTVLAAMWLGLLHWALYIRQEYGWPWEKQQ